jgi:hypothetical protein
MSSGGWFLAVAFSVVSALGAKKDAAVVAKAAERVPAVLWQEPADIEARNLFYGPGGQKHEPHGTFTFEKEDLDGTNPKFVVRDEDGVKWKVKLGVEARPETAASRLVWAAGYSANEDYFMPVLQVKNLPARLKRGQKLRQRDGSFRNVRLKRYLKHEEKADIWRWRENPFTGTKELEGLRVMMALLNNWDLKDVNNAVYLDERDKGEPQKIYMISDLGASFGTTGESWTHSRSKGNLKAYQRSKFISKAGPDYVNFNVPTRPALIFVVNPHEFFSRVHLEWIGRRIRRTDVEWMGGVLAKLSPAQIRDAFRAAGYSPAEVEGFAGVVEKRIAELRQL